jgi:hypothetical protein
MWLKGPIVAALFVAVVALAALETWMELARPRY